MEVYENMKVGQMKKLISLVALVAISIMLAVGADAQTWVNGYTKKSGTYVQGHYRSSPDSSKYNNWSTKGNVNPYTGKAGTKNVYPSYGSSSNSYGYGSQQKPKSNLSY